MQGIQSKNNNNGKAQMFVIFLLASVCKVAEPVEPDFRIWFFPDPDFEVKSEQARQGLSVDV